jgi:hypothetical protein
MSQGTVALIGIIATLAVAGFNLFHSMSNNKITRFVDTVTASRMKWIDSLRDKVSAFIAVTVHLEILMMQMSDQTDDIRRERNMLVEQIIMHLNPQDDEDEAIRVKVEQLVTLVDHGHFRETGGRPLSSFVRQQEHISKKNGRR